MTATHASFRGSVRLQLSHEQEARRVFRLRISAAYWVLAAHRPRTHSRSSNCN